MNTEEYKKHLFHPKSDNYILFGHLKQEGDYDKIKKVYRSLIGHPFVKSSLKINILPKDYSDIRKQKPLPFSGNFVGESSFYLLCRPKICLQFLINNPVFTLQLIFTFAPSYCSGVGLC